MTDIEANFLATSCARVEVTGWLLKLRRSSKSPWLSTGASCSCSGSLAASDQRRGGPLPPLLLRARSEGEMSPLGGEPGSCCLTEAGRITDGVCEEFMVNVEDRKAHV